MSLYKKYRPQKMSEVYGNADLKETIAAHFKKKEHNHAILLYGESGCGKTTIARIIGKEFLGIEDNEIMEINASTENGVDDVRAMVERMKVLPITANYNLFIVDECQMLTPAAKSALLKPCEDGASFNYIVFCTTNPTKFFKGDKGESKTALVTRLTQWKVEPLNPRESGKLINSVAAKEGIELSDAVFSKIVDKGAGSSRDLLVKLESVIGLDETKALSQLERGINVESESEAAADFAKLICGGYKTAPGNTGACLKALAELKKSGKEEPVSLAKMLMAWSAGMLLNQGFNERAASVLQNMAKHYENPTNSEWSVFTLAVLESTM